MAALVRGVTLSEPSESSWVVDAGAENHIANSPGKFITLKPCRGNGFITGDGSTHPSHRKCFDHYIDWSIIFERCVSCSII